MEAFLQLDDSIIDKLWELKITNDTEKTHNLIERLRKRSLYKLIGQFTQQHLEVSCTLPCLLH